VAAGTVLIGAEDLRILIEAIFRRSGLSPQHAATVADVLLWADLRGIDTHGATRVPRYVDLIERGDMNPAPVLSTRNAGAAAVLLEADRAPGPVAMVRGMDQAIHCARAGGIGLTIVRATTHTAALGYYTCRAAAHNMIGIAFCASQPNMIYHGARSPGVSTSPLSIAVPAGSGEPLVLDFGAGVVSVGRLMQARKLGQPIPPGWALDGAGQPTTDAARAAAPLPMAGPKGAGLALMVELVTSLLAANPLLAEALEGTAPGARHGQNAAAIAIDIARFVEPQAFAQQASRLVCDLKALPRADPAEEIRMPGERGARERRERLQAGIPLPQPVYRELRELANRLGVALP